jgi:hypothetical protein
MPAPTPDPLPAENPSGLRTAIVRIRTPELPAEWNRPAGVYIGNEVEVAVLDEKTGEPIAVLNQVQRIVIEVPREGFVFATIETDGVKFDVKAEAKIEPPQPALPHVPAAEIDARIGKMQGGGPGEPYGD